MGISDRMGALKRLAAVVFATAVLGGCGGSEDEDEAPGVPDEERAVLKAIDALQAASRQGDASRICNEIFTKELANAIGAAANRSCETEVRETLVSPDTRLSVERKIQINGARASASVRETDGETSKVFLVRQGRRWKIDRIRPIRSG